MHILIGVHFFSQFIHSQIARTQTMTNPFQHFYDYIQIYHEDDRLYDDIRLGNIEDDDPRFQDLESFDEVKEFINAVFEIAFGDNAINRGFTTTDVIDQLKELSNNYVN